MKSSMTYSLLALFLATTRLVSPMLTIRSQTAIPGLKYDPTATLLRPDTPYDKSIIWQVYGFYSHDCLSIPDDRYTPDVGKRVINNFAECLCANKTAESKPWPQSPMQEWQVEYTYAKHVHDPSTGLEIWSVYLNDPENHEESWKIGTALPKPSNPSVKVHPRLIRMEFNYINNFPSAPFKGAEKVRVTYENETIVHPINDSWRQTAPECVTHTSIVVVPKAEQVHDLAKIKKIEIWTVKEVNIEANDLPGRHYNNGLTMVLSGEYDRKEVCS